MVLSSRVLLAGTSSNPGGPNGGRPISMQQTLRVGLDLHPPIRESSQKWEGIANMLHGLPWGPYCDVFLRTFTLPVGSAVYCVQSRGPREGELQEPRFGNGNSEFAAASHSRWLLAYLHGSCQPLASQTVEPVGQTMMPFGAGRILVGTTQIGGLSRPLSWIRQKAERRRLRPPQCATSEVVARLVRRHVWRTGERNGVAMLSGSKITQRVGAIFS